MGEANFYYFTCLKNRNFDLLFLAKISQKKMSKGKNRNNQWQGSRFNVQFKDSNEQRTKNEYKKLLRKAEFKNFKSEVLARPGPKPNSSETKEGRLKLKLKGDKAPRHQSQKQSKHGGKLLHQQQQQQQQQPRKESAFSKAERDRKKVALAAAEAEAKRRADAEARRKAKEMYEKKKKSDFKRLSKKTRKGQPHMGSQMQILLAKIEKQMN